MMLLHLIDGKVLTAHGTRLSRDMLLSELVRRREEILSHQQPEITEEWKLIQAIETELFTRYGVVINLAFIQAPSPDRVTR